jgi:hypothetical protein
MKCKPCTSTRLYVQVHPFIILALANMMAQPHLFPAHRVYIWAYEKALREECGYTGYQPVHSRSIPPRLMRQLTEYSIGTGVARQLILLTRQCSMVTCQAWEATV